MQIRLKYIVATLFAISSFHSGFAQKSEPPRLEKYPADVYAGKPAPLNLRSHRLAHVSHQHSRQLHEAGINFAGHYTIAAMGCGTGLFDHGDCRCAQR